LILLIDPHAGSQQPATTDQIKGKKKVAGNMSFLMGTIAIAAKETMADPRYA